MREDGHGVALHDSAVYMRFAMRLTEWNRSRLTLAIVSKQCGSRCFTRNAVCEQASLGLYVGKRSTFEFILFVIFVIHFTHTA